LTIVTGVSVRVPAKLNLQLAVGPPRADGYHDLVTVFHAVSLFDEVTAEPAGRDGVTVTGEGADRVPADQDNLALRAVAALRAAMAGPATGFAVDPGGVHITIAKRIPVAAGLAQGPGFPNLSCLGLLSDRILRRYVAPSEPVRPASENRAHERRERV